MAMSMWNKRLTIFLIVIGVMLLIPFIAMQFTNEVNWSLFDFIVAGTLLSGTAVVCEIVIRNVKETRFRIAICAVILAILVLVCIELAVGIFGTPFAGN